MKSDSARINTAAVADAAGTSAAIDHPTHTVTVDRPSSGNSSERLTPHLLTSTPPTYTQVVNGSHSFIENFADWYEIIKLLTTSSD